MSPDAIEAASIHRSAGLRDPAYALPVRAAAAGRSGLDRLRNDRARPRPRRYRLRRRGSHSRHPHPDQRDVRGHSEADRAACNPDAIKVHRLRESDVASGRARWRRSCRSCCASSARGRWSATISNSTSPWSTAACAAGCGIDLPNPRIEVSGFYYDRKYGDAPPGAQVDLRFARSCRSRSADAGPARRLADALMTAMIYVKLRDLAKRGATQQRPR